MGGTIALPIRQPRARVFDPSTGARAHKIVRIDLAAWMVGGLDDGAFAHQTPTLRPTAKPDPGPAGQGGRRRRAHLRGRCVGRAAAPPPRVGA